MQARNETASRKRAESGTFDSVNRSIELVPVEQLLPYKANARTHSRKQIRQIANSIERFGFANPILVDDQNGIIAGHGRVEAAKLLGLSEIPALRLSHLSAVERRAYIIADNKLAQKAGWDREILAIELQGLIDLDFDVELTGFEMGEIDILLDDVDETRREAAGPDDESPDLLPGPSVSQAGNVWILGNHRIMCGDALDQGIDVAVRRWQAYTGKVAILEESGKSFEEIEGERIGSTVAAHRERLTSGEAQ
jgi:ParB-like nuclease domain